MRRVTTRLPSLPAMSFVTHLESAIDGTELAHDRLQTLHDGRPLWVRYDLDEVARHVRRDDLEGRDTTMWRYRELLPVDRDENIVSLGEGMTPLLKCERLGNRLGLSNLWMAGSSVFPAAGHANPTWTLVALAVRLARQLNEANDR